jgi:hypothetical protein
MKGATIIRGEGLGNGTIITHGSQINGLNEQASVKRLKAFVGRESVFKISKEMKSTLKVTSGIYHKKSEE